MTSESETIDARAWQELHAAAHDPHSGFRYLSVCTLDPEGKPQARMMVLRRADTTLRLLEFHTDIRSDKWQELSLNPHATVLGFCAQSRLQLRLQGHFKRHEYGSVLAEEAWAGMAAWTRMTYAGGPPGDEQAIQRSVPPHSGQEDRGAEGKHNFGVMVFYAASLDWFRLKRDDNRRARLIYSDTGSLTSFTWINP